MLIAMLFGFIIGYVIAEVVFGITHFIKMLMFSYLRLMAAKPLVGIIGTIVMFLLVRFQIMIIWEAMIVVVFVLGVFVIIDNQEQKA